MARVLAVADEVEESFWAGKPAALRPDLVLCAGDLPWDYLEFIASTVSVPVLFVPGNHDPAVEKARLHRNGQHYRAGLPVDAPRPHGVRCLDGEVARVAGLWIAGLGGCVRYRPGPNQYTQGEYRRRVKSLQRKVSRIVGSAPGTLDVLLTHAPARGLGDGPDRPHTGIEALVPLLDQLRPRWHLHGHVHPYGLSRPDRRYRDILICNVIPHRMLQIDPALGEGS